MSEMSCWIDVGNGMVTTVVGGGSAWAQVLGFGIMNERVFRPITAELR